MKWGIAAVIFCLSAMAWGQTLPGKAPEARRAVAVAEILISDDSPETRAAVARLCAVQEKFAPKQATLRQVTDALRLALGVNLVVMWANVETAGVKQETPVSFSLDQVSGDQLLRTTMALAAPGQLDYLVSDGVVELHTRAWMERRKFPRSYTIKPLVEKGFYTETLPEQRAAALLELCQATATPGAWKGAGYVCKFSGGELIVAAPMRTHYELSDLFSDLYHPVRVSPERGAKVEVPAWLMATSGWEEASKALAGPATMTLEDQPLGAVLDRLRVGALRNMVVDWASLAKIGATPETRVSYRPENPAAKLEQMLRDVGGEKAQQGGEAVAIVCGVEGVVTITTPGVMEPAERIAVYDLRDLVRRKIFQNQRQKMTPQEVMKGILGELEKARFAFKMSGDTAPAGAAGAVAEKAGVFAEFEGLLVVRAGPDVHRRLAQALSGLAR